MSKNFTKKIQIKKYLIYLNFFKFDFLKNEKMKKIFTLIINFAINKAKRSKFVQNIFESPFEISNFKKKASFIDSFNNKHYLLEGLKNKIKPNWKNILKDKNIKITKEYLLGQKENGFIAVQKIIPVLKSLNKDISKSDILEIGCNNGAMAFAMAEMKANVIATEFSGYKVESISSKKINQRNLIEVNDSLKLIRNSLSNLFSHSKNVKFLDDDICNSVIKNNSFDIICSWEVLEHLHDTEKAFQAIYNLLKDDGITIHEYNPFFCLNGGHSLCTTDFLWGHTILNENDFTRYLEEFYPEMKDKALSFYKKGLNRMTIYDLEKQFKNAGLEIISILPFTKEQHLRMIDKEIVLQTQKNYPNSSILDLVTPRVIVIAKKKK